MIVHKQFRDQKGRIEQTFSSKIEFLIPKWIQ
jgi:hypothetical protein